MKIGYFTSSFPYKNPVTKEMIRPHLGGGVENVTYNLAVQMAKKGHEVFIFTSSIDPRDSTEEYGNIKIYRYRRNLKIGRGSISLNLIYKPLFLDFKDLDLDIVHSHIGNLPAPLTAYLYAKKRKKPLVTTYHEDYIGGFGTLTRRFGVYLFDSFIADKMLSGSDIVLTPSEYYIDKSRHLRNVSSKVKAIPNGINLEEFRLDLSKDQCRTKLGLPLNKKIILFVGNLTPRKAPHILIGSMKRVQTMIPDSILVLVGAGEYIHELNKLGESLGISQNIIFTGFIEDSLKAYYYYSSDIFVLPSFSEGFGIVLLEASACGLPLVVSDLEVFNSVVTDGYNGLFTEAGNKDDLAKKIIHLLQNEDLRIKMGKNAKENSNKFSWDRIADETERIYLNSLL